MENMKRGVVDVCDIRSLDGQRRNRSEWWNGREELFRNGYRKELGVPMRDTGQREWY